MAVVYADTHSGRIGLPGYTVSAYWKTYVHNNRLGVLVLSSTAASNVYGNDLSKYEVSFLPNACPHAPFGGIWQGEILGSLEVWMPDLRNVGENHGILNHDPRLQGAWYKFYCGYSWDHIGIKP